MRRAVLALWLALALVAPAVAAASELHDRAPMRGRPWLGPAEPRVIMTLALDPTDAEAAKAWQTAQAVAQREGADLAVTVVLAPKPGSIPSIRAAEALVAAASEGRFWAGLRAMTAPVDPSSPAPVSDPAAAAFVRAEMVSAARLRIGVRPVFFVNGTRIEGAVPEARLRGAIAFERAAAQLAQREGRVDIGEAWLRERLSAAAPLLHLPAMPQPGPGVSEARWRVRFAPDDPRLGDGAAAQSTLVLFADPTTPAAGAALAAAEAAVAGSAGRLRLIWKASTHAPRAALAARTLRCSGAKFWSLVRRLAKLPLRQRRVDLGYALLDVGLDPGKTLDCADAAEARRGVERDRRAAALVDAKPPVALFLDGVRLPWPIGRGALDAAVARALRASASLHAAGESADAVHARLTEGGQQATPQRRRGSSLPSPYGR